MQALEARENIHCIVFSELKKLGIKVPKSKKFMTNVPKQVKSNSPSNNNNNKVFGVHLSDQEKVFEANSFLPKFIVLAISYLKIYAKKEIGLFRKTGSISRQRVLRAKIEKGESIDESEPNDVASLLKQWLRELPEPLIPGYLHDLFIRCLLLKEDEKKINALLLCCHLLPPDHLCTLKHLLNFLSYIARNCDRNRMGAYNLALMMAPNVFVMGSNSIDKSSGNLVQHHTAILELLINNAEKVGQVPICTSQHLLETEALEYGTDLDSSTDALRYSPAKKKIKGGPVQGLVNGFRKLVGQNTPINPSKRGNIDETKLTSASRPAFVPRALQNEIMASTSQNTWNIFGTMKKNQSHQKSVGLLQKKEPKRCKSSKSSTKEPKINHEASRSFQDELHMSLQASTDPIKDSCCDKSSPLLSVSHIDRIFSKASTVKKSVSDNYLTVLDEFKNVPDFSTHSSQGCLLLEDYEHSPYYLRSHELDKKSSKRKLSVSNAEMKADLELETSKESIFQNNLPNDCRRKVKVSPIIKKKAPENKASNVKSTNVLNETKASLNGQNCSNITINESNLNKILDAFEVSNPRCSSWKENNFGCIIDLNISSSGNSIRKVQKPEDEPDTVRNGIKTKNHTVSDISKSVSLCSTLITENGEGESAGKNPVHDREASAVKSKNKPKNSLEQAANKKNEMHRENEVTVSRSFRNIEGSTTLGRKQMTKNVRKGSIVRGRPNTVKTGLRLDSCGRLNFESCSNRQFLTSTTSADNSFLINTIDNSGKDNNISVISEFEKLNLSTLNENHATKLSQQNCVINPELTVCDRKIKIPSKRKRRERISSNSDSKIHNTRKRLSGVSRVKSFPDHNTKIARPKRLRVMNRSSPKKNESPSRVLQKDKEDAQSSLQTFTSNDAQKENLHIQVSPNVLVQVTTPDTNGKSPETWTSGRRFFESQPVTEEVVTKRESIAMILNSKSGHVKAKVSLYDTRSRSSCTNTPLKSSLSSPVFSDSQNSNTLKKSQKSNSVRSSAKTCDFSIKDRTKFYSPLSPPPKFVFSDLNPSSPVVSYPLKELTNINRAENTALSVSPAMDSFHTPLQYKSPVDSDNKVSCTKSRRNSFCGHTPYKIPKVYRSESSPLLTKEDVDKLQKKANESLSRRPSLNNYFCSPVFKYRSSLNIEGLQYNQLVEEWNCEV